MFFSISHPVLPHRESVYISLILGIGTRTARCRFFVPGFDSSSDTGVALRFWQPCPYNRRMPRFYERASLVAARQQWRQEGRKVVFTNGCYDILHPGHIRLLERARNLGDILILALNTDSSVQRLKGPKRPFLSEQQRAQIAISLEAVDAVTLFDEDTPRELIAAVLPDVLIKGADWSHFIAGREEVEAAGGQVLALSLEPGYSTTNIVDQIVQRQP